MTLTTQAKIWGIALVVFIALLVLLKGILLPFVAGMAIAYMLDPMCDRLERVGTSRTLATTIVTAVFAIVVILLLLLIVPLVVQQAVAFLGSLPDLISQTYGRIEPYYLQLQQRLDLPPPEELTQIARTRFGSALTWLANILQQLVGQGLAFANLLSLIFITPVVTFYLLRDWDRLVAKIDELLPRHHAGVIRTQAGLVDRTLAGFARGQSMVCLILALFYGTALMIVGLPFGIIIGLIAGLLTFVPYVGSLTGFVVSVAVAIGHYDDWWMVALVAIIFIVGQAVEGNFLTPKLVGDRVGLHPVWVIFALLAGGALFGFVGLLLAVPLAAVIGVLVRFSIGQYRASKLYLGTAPPAISLVEPEDPTAPDSRD
ncbi:AI-2E family transporter [Dongia deserti]|uniref:AI-2E family transporter n=1 Tax=Dongia deserti TaxID=2268030 RepID=UPI000E65C91D|nr:AI-2E family transporter [Dongia deserti]